MTNRERFHAVLEGKKGVDRCPVVEWCTWWAKTVAFWEGEAMPVGMSAGELFDYFGLDHNTQFWPEHRRYDRPDTDLPSGEMMENEADYESLRPYLYPDNAISRLKEDIEQALPKYQSGESIVWYTLEGFFWFPRVLFGISNHLLSFYDYPELYHRICDDLAAWHIRTIDELAGYMKADAMTFAEDMSYNHGSMISKDLYDEFMLPYYKRVIPEIKKHGTKVFIDSDGDISELVPWFEEAGIDGILPLERQAGVDIAQIRADHPSFMMIGAFDKMSILKGKDDIRREFERLLPVIRSGRYIPNMDHQTPPGTTLENYRYYVQLLREYAAQSCMDCTTTK